MLNQIIRALGFLEGASAITCDSCGKRKKGQYWESDDLPGKKFCTKKCVDLFGSEKFQCAQCRDEFIGHYISSEDNPKIKYCSVDCSVASEPVEDYDLDKPIVVEEIFTDNEYIKKNLYIRVFRYGAVNSKESSWWQTEAVNINNEDKEYPDAELFTEQDAKDKAIAYAKKLAKRYKTNIINPIKS